MTSPDTGGGGSIAFTESTYVLYNTQIEKTGRTREALPYALLSDTVEKMHPGDVITAGTVITTGLLDPEWIANDGPQIDTHSGDGIDTITITFPGITGQGDTYKDDGFMTDEGSLTLAINEFITYTFTFQFNGQGTGRGWTNET